MSQPSDDFMGIARRIETLTNILQHMNHKAQPRRNEDQIPSFLRHFTTLLTYGPGNKSNTGVVAVTGTIENADSTESGPRVKALVVVQNANSSNESLEVKKVTQRPTSFDDLVKEYA